MVNFDRTERDFIRKQIDEVSEPSRIGRVVSVYEHTESDDDTNFEVDVLFPQEDTQHRQIPIQSSNNDSIAIPKVGDKVLVEYRRGETNMPIARNFVYTNKDRPPVGRAGMWRQRFEAADGSPAGDGNIHLTGYTSYDGDPSEDDKTTIEPTETWLQIAKHGDEDTPPEDPPLKIEVYDSPSSENDAAHVSIELNNVDGSNSSATWGMKFDLKDGSMTMLDGEGYGIESDGQGNFTWHHEAVDFSEGSTSSL